MSINPELQRYGWLEFSLQRVIVLPLLMGTIIFLASYQEPPEEAINYAAKIMFLLLAGLWGGHKASQSVMEEVGGNTWDWQRLSSLSPWSLTIGKLFGSTSYCWYGALLALACYALTASVYIPAQYVLCDTVLLLFGGLICHVTAIFVSLIFISGPISTRRKIRSNGAHAVGLLLGSLAVMATSSITHYGSRPTGHYHYQHGGFEQVQGPEILWYGIYYDETVFVTLFAPIFFLWILAGTSSLMRSQLRMRTGPWLWAAFTLFMMAFASGFAFSWHDHILSRGVLLTSFVTGMVLLYFMVLAEQCNGVTYRKLKEHWKNKRRSIVIDMFPRWAVSLILVMLALLGVAATSPDNTNIIMLVLTLFCFAMRDIGLLHYFKLHPQSNRAVTATIFYLGILYILVPAFFRTISHPELAALFSGINVGYKDNDMVMPLLSSALQAFLMTSLAFSRWRKYWQS